MKSCETHDGQGYRQPQTHHFHRKCERNRELTNVMRDAQTLFMEVRALGSPHVRLEKLFDTPFFLKSPVVVHNYLINLACVLCKGSRVRTVGQRDVRDQTG